jgi:hypothetical protein
LLKVCIHLLLFSSFFFSSSSFVLSFFYSVDVYTSIEEMNDAFFVFSFKNNIHIVCQYETSCILLASSILLSSFNIFLNDGSVRINEKTRWRVDNIWNFVGIYVLKVRTAIFHHLLLVLFLSSFIYPYIGVYERYRRFVLLCCSFFLQFCSDGLSLTAKWSRRRRRRRRRKRRRRCQHQHRRLNIFAL